MSDLLKSALSYIGSSSSSGSGSTSTAPNNAPTPVEIIKLGGENVKLLKIIAEGGSSYIYGGQFVQNNLVIAVKKIPCQHDNEDKILSEIKFMNGFSHVNVAKYYGYNKISGVYWIGLEYCSSLRLPVPLETVGPVFGQIVSGVEYLHNLGITHWDLKVENCMIGRDQMIKLIDFGSSTTKTFKTSHLTTMQRNQLEDELFQLTTPMYRPPEILDLWSEMIIDFHVDIWALGCILYYLVHTEHPFSDSNKLAIINCKYPRKPSMYENLIEGLLVINPPDRSSLQDVLRHLQYVGVNYTSKIPLPFEEFQLGPMNIPNNPSTSLLHSIRGGAESLFKNLKESGSRIYSTHSQQPQQTAQPNQPPPLPPKDHQQVPRRPPPPVPPPPHEIPRTQLTGEDVASKNNVAKPEPTSYDLIGGFGGREEQGRPSNIPPISTAESVDLLGGLKEEIPDLAAGAKSSNACPNTNEALLEDLFGMSQPAAPVPPTNPAPKQEIKKDLFDSLFSEQYATSEKPLLPTSSSYNHLSSLRVDNKNELVKSTPNLNDLFGDLLLDPSSSGQKSGSNVSGGITFGSSTQNANNSTAKPTFGVGTSYSKNSVGIGAAGGAMKGSSNNGSGSNNFVGTGSVFSSFHANPSAMNYSSDRSAAYQSHDNPVKAAPTAGVGTTTVDSKTQSVPGANKKLDLNAAFGELLNEQGFSTGSSTVNATKTINDMRRVELMQTKTPEQIKVSEWVEGKRKNIRALLSSLHTVVWDSCSWKATSMSVMVEPNDVKKVYRKACLAIHPDKQLGEPCEELAKLIFVELNEAWSHFEKDHF